MRTLSLLAAVCALLVAGDARPQPKEMKAPSVDIVDIKLAKDGKGVSTITVRDRSAVVDKDGVRHNQVLELTVAPWLNQGRLMPGDDKRAAANRRVYRLLPRQLYKGQLGVELLISMKPGKDGRHVLYAIGPGQDLKAIARKRALWQRDAEMYAELEAREKKAREKKAREKKAKD
jgi:hypothetical protein